MDVTEKQLAEKLKDFSASIRTGKGETWWGVLDEPGKVAEGIWRRLGGTHEDDVPDPGLYRKLVTAFQALGLVDVVDDGCEGSGNLTTASAARLASTALTVVREHDETGGRHPTGPRTKDADLCAHCGNRFPAGQLCDPCKQAAGFNGVDRKRLTEALREFRLTVRDEFGQATHGVVMLPGQAASDLLDLLSANAAHPEPAPHAHACDGQCPHDAEVHAMAALAPLLPLVSRLSHDARERVTEWARRRACDGLPPF